MVPSSSMEQQFLKKLIDIIDTNLHNEHFGVTELAEELGMSRITLHRKVKSVVKKSVSEFIREARLKRAYELLQKKTGTVSEIAFSVGFGSVSYFNRCFHEYYGYTPGEIDKYADIENSQDDNKPHPSLKKNKWQRTTPILLFLLLLVSVISAIHYFRPNNNGNNKPEKSIAVLPFSNNSSDSTNGYFINGLTEEIISKLSAIKDLRVISCSSTEQYLNNSDKSITQIASELGANYIVEGSGQIIDSMIKVTVGLIEAKTNKVLISQPYARNLEEIFSLQEEIALLVASKINAAIYNS